MDFLTYKNYASCDEAHCAYFCKRIDNELKFEHVKKLCKKSNEKLMALSRITPYMNTEKLKMTMNAFLNSQFGYCPFLWMFHCGNLNNCINNRIQEKA